MLCVLTASVEISDQMDRCFEIVVGVFDNPVKLREAREATDRFYSTRRVAFHELDVTVNRQRPLHMLPE